MLWTPTGLNRRFSGCKILLALSATPTKRTIRDNATHGCFLLAPAECAFPKLLFSDILEPCCLEPEMRRTHIGFDVPFSLRGVIVVIADGDTLQLAHLVSRQCHHIVSMRHRCGVMFQSGCTPWTQHPSMKRDKHTWSESVMSVEQLREVPFARRRSLRTYCDFGTPHRGNCRCSSLCFFLSSLVRGTVPRNTKFFC